MKLSWSMVAAALSALAGVVGTVLTPILGTNLSDHIGIVLQAVSGLLLAIAGWHVTSVAAASAKLANAEKSPAVKGATVTVHL